MGSTPRWVPPPANRSRSWQELPAELTESILWRVSAVDRLLSARKVCKTWRRICSDPNMWRVVDLWHSGDPNDVYYNVDYIARQAVDLSRGQLIEFGISYFADDRLLDYISKRSSQLRSLHLASCDITTEGLIEMIKKLPLLYELHLYCIRISKQAIEVVAWCCPQLKTFRLNYQGNGDLYSECDENALAIAENMPGLCHLQLLGNRITRDGLVAILDNCPRLESLDIRHCFQAVSLGPDLVRRLSQQMKYLRLPYDSTEDCELDDDVYDMDSCNEDDPYGQSDEDIVSDDYDYYNDYNDDYDNYNDDYDYYNDDYDYNENSGGSDIDSD